MLESHSEAFPSSDGSILPRLRSSIVLESMPFVCADQFQEESRVFRAVLLRYSKGQLYALPAIPFTCIPRMPSFAFATFPAVPMSIRFESLRERGKV